MNDILIVGAGNPLLKDEGIGVYIIEKLVRIGLPSNVQIIDCGSDLSSILTQLRSHRKIIIIDAIRAGGEPGQVYRFNYDELKEVKNRLRSAHQLSVVEMLKLLKQTYHNLSSCKIILIGIEPETISPGTKLSKKVEASIDEAISTVLREILPEKDVLEKVR